MPAHEAENEPSRVADQCIQEKKHHGTEGRSDASAVQPGMKPRAAAKRRDPGVAPAARTDPAASESAVPSASPPPEPPPALEGSLVVLAKLKELEFHSRATLERLAELALTVENELKQEKMIGPLGEVYSAQSALQTKLTTLIETYKAECDRMQSQSGVS